jgi:type I restriction enzyme S subunit
MTEVIHTPTLSSPIPDGWRWSRLQDVCSLFDCPHSTPQLASEGPYIVRSQDIRAGVFSRDGAACVSEQTYIQRTVRAVPSYGDLLFSREGTYFGIAAEVPANTKVCLGQRMVLLRPASHALDFQFLKYWLNSPIMVGHVRGFRDGSVAERLNVPTIKSLAVVLPPIREQQLIGQYLSILDQKIELNGRMNKTVEAIACAIFKSWFADSEMPSTSSLDAVADFLNGLALQRFPPTGAGDLPVIKIAELRRGDTKGSDLANGDIPSEYVVNDGDVLFSWSGTLEVVIWCGGKGALNQHLFKVTSRHYPKWFYYFWIKEHLQDFQAIAASKATTMGHIQRHHLTEARVRVPSDKSLRAGDSVIAPMVNRIICNALESRTLAALRDTLLPKLLSGEIRLKDAKNIVEAHA